MAKIGDHRYPDDLDPDEAEEVMDTLVNEYGGLVENREAFAQALGHSSKKSGAFARKIADARKYGLITPRGDYEATELGFRLANPRDEEDRQEAKYEMLSNIELLSELESQLNGNKPPEQFWRILHDMLDINPKDARDASGRLNELYREMRQLKPEEEEEKEVGSTKENLTNQGSDSSGQQESQAQMRRESAEKSALYLRIGDDEIRFSELTEINIEIAQKFLESKQEEMRSNDDSDPTLEQTRLG